MTKLLALIPSGLWRESQGIQPIYPPCQLWPRRRPGMLTIMSHCFEVLRGQNRTKGFFFLIIERRRRSRNYGSLYFSFECVEIRKKKISQ
jgi:hypothetical protein